MNNKIFRKLALIAFVVATLCVCRLDASAQDGMCCLTSVDAYSPSGINPAPSVGVISGYGLTTEYGVYYCSCLSTEYYYYVSESGQATIGQECPESAACYVYNDSYDYICAPAFYAPVGNVNGWYVTTVPYTVFASTEQCADGEEGEIGFCDTPYWEVTGCVAGTPDIHTYSGPSSCSGASLDSGRSDEIQVASEAEALDEPGTDRADVVYQCAASSVTNPTGSKRTLECSSPTLGLSASLAVHSHNHAFGHTPLYR